MNECCSCNLCLSNEFSGLGTLKRPHTCAVSSSNGKIASAYDCVTCRSQRSKRSACSASPLCRSAFNTGPQLAHGDHRQIQRYGITARHLKEFPNTGLSLLALANLTDDIGIHEIHRLPTTIALLTPKITVLPTFAESPPARRNRQRPSPRPRKRRFQNLSMLLLRTAIPASPPDASAPAPTPPANPRTINCAMTSLRTAKCDSIASSRNMLSMISIGSAGHANCGSVLRRLARRWRGVVTQACARISVANPRAVLIRRVGQTTRQKPEEALAKTVMISFMNDSLFF